MHPLTKDPLALKGLSSRGMLNITAVAIIMGPFQQPKLLGCLFHDIISHSNLLYDIIMRHCSLFIYDDKYGEIGF